MTPRWLISIPVWGDAWVRRFLETGLPSITAALEGLPAQVRFVVHSNSQLLRMAMAGYPVIYRPAQVREDRYDTLSDCQREAMNLAEDEERVCFLNADHIISAVSLCSAEYRFQDGYKAVACGCIRTHGDYPPVGATGRDLLAWAWKFAHPLIRDCVFGTGRSQWPSLVYFEDGPNVVLRAFHLHPFAVVKDRPLFFHGTIDQGLLDRYPMQAIHVVTDPDELSMAEVTGLEHKHPSGPLISSELLSRFGLRATPLHRWFFTHSIRIQGYEPVDESPAEETLKIMRESALAPVQLTETH